MLENEELIFPVARSRLGRSYQTEVPDWSGVTNEETDPAFLRPEPVFVRPKTFTDEQRTIISWFRAVTDTLRGFLTPFFDVVFDFLVPFGCFFVLLIPFLVLFFLFLMPFFFFWYLILFLFPSFFSFPFHHSVQEYMSAARALLLDRQKSAPPDWIPLMPARSRQNGTDLNISLSLQALQSNNFNSETALASLPALFDAQLNDKRLLWTAEEREQFFKAVLQHGKEAHVVLPEIPTRSSCKHVIEYMWMWRGSAEYNTYRVQKKLTLDEKCDF